MPYLVVPVAPDWVEPVWPPWVVEGWVAPNPVPDLYDVVPVPGSPDDVLAPVPVTEPIAPLNPVADW